MAFDERLAERIRGCMQQRQGITERKMFGGLAFLADGHMCVGILGTSLMARVGVEAYAGALKRPHVRAMDFTGKPMRGYVYVDAPALASDRDLRTWVQACLRFVATLPPKSARPAAPRRR